MSTFAHPMPARLSVVFPLVLCGLYWSQSQTCEGQSPPNTAIPVRVDATTGMTRGGKPYFVKGAGGEKNMKELAARGANSLRTCG